MVEIGGSNPKYATEVTSVGEMAKDFAAEGMLVFFGPQAPDELHDIAIITGPSPLVGVVAPGDILNVDGARFRISGVGDRANANIAELGHLVVKLNGLAETELPGDVSVEPGELPVLEPGIVIQILKGL